MKVKENGSTNWRQNKIKKKLTHGYGPKKQITARVHLEMSRCKYYRNVRFVKIIHNLISVSFQYPEICAL